MTIPGSKTILYTIIYNDRRKSIVLARAAGGISVAPSRLSLKSELSGDFEMAEYNFLWYSVFCEPAAKGPALWEKKRFECVKWNIS